MSEKIPTPSTEFSRAATQRDIAEGIPYGEGRKYELLDAWEAAHAAKPFMDVAVDLYNAQEDGTQELALQYGNLDSLIDYAERCARLAAEKGEARELSDDEEKILDVFRAQAESDKVTTEFGDVLVSMTDKDVLAASAEAGDRFNQAASREERNKLNEMELKLERYAHYLSSGNDDQYKEFTTDTGDAASLLQRMNVETGETTEWDREPIDRKKLLIQARNLRTEAEMLSFVGSHIKLEKQKEQFAKITTSHRLGERNASNEAPEETHEPHYDVVDTVAEAKKLIYDDPDYLAELINESESYARFSSDKLDPNDAAISNNLKAMERDLPEVRQIVQDWRAAESGMNFRQYIEAAAEGDFDVTQEQRNAAHSAKSMLKNMFWREPQMTRRMAERVTDKSDTGDLDKAFSAEYFGKG